MGTEEEYEELNFGSEGEDTPRRNKNHNPKGNTASLVVECILEHTTDKAYCVARVMETAEDQLREKAVWIPKSQVSEFDLTGEITGQGVEIVFLTVSNWIAKQKGWC